MLTIKFKTDNASFEDKYEECARILEDAAKKLRQGYVDFALVDSNGNTVGRAILTKR